MTRNAQMIRNALVVTILYFLLLTAIVALLVLIDLVGFYRVNYSHDYGAYALTFGLNTYIPLYALPIPTLFLSILAFGVFLGAEKRLSVEEITEYTGGAAMLSAGAFFVSGLITVLLLTDPGSTVSRIIFLNAMGAAMVGMVVGMFSITTCVLTEVVRNQLEKRALRKRRESIN